MDYNDILGVFKENGFKLSKSETLRNKEYKEEERNIYINEELSVFNNFCFGESYTFILLVDKNFFNNDIVKTLMSGLKNIGASQVEANIQNEENEFIISLNIII
jgi:hypothetical protein